MPAPTDFRHPGVIGRPMSAPPPQSTPSPSLSAQNKQSAAQGDSTSYLNVSSPTSSSLAKDASQVSLASGMRSSEDDLLRFMPLLKLSDEFLHEDDQQRQDKAIVAGVVSPTHSSASSTESILNRGIMLFHSQLNSPPSGSNNQSELHQRETGLLMTSRLHPGGSTSAATSPISSMHTRTSSRFNFYQQDGKQGSILDDNALHSALTPKPWSTAKQQMTTPLPLSTPSIANAQQQMHFFSAPVSPNKKRVITAATSISGTGINPSMLTSPLQPNIPNVLNTKKSSLPIGASMNNSPINQALHQSQLPALLDALRINPTHVQLDLTLVLNNAVICATDPHGSRFIQQCLEMIALAEGDPGMIDQLQARVACLQELLTHDDLAGLCMDPLANYVFQRFFEYGTPEIQSLLSRALAAMGIDLLASVACHPYGCRVLQKALECNQCAHEQSLLMNVLHPSVLTLVCDPNGHHVIVRCLDCIPAVRAPWFAKCFMGNLLGLAQHPYGCRVVQRIFEHDLQSLPPAFATRIDRDALVAELISHSLCLVQDQYGNYVVQNVLEHGSPTHRRQVIEALKGSFLLMACHKYASNAIEKCFIYGDLDDRDLMLRELLVINDHETAASTDISNRPIEVMLKDQFANYVVQKMLDVLTQERGHRHALLMSIKPYLPMLRSKFTYGKHILAKVERLIYASRAKQHATVPVNSSSSNGMLMMSSLATNSKLKFYRPAKDHHQVDDTVKMNNSIRFTHNNIDETEKPRLVHSIQHKIMAKSFNNHSHQVINEAHNESHSNSNNGPVAPVVLARRQSGNSTVSATTTSEVGQVKVPISLTPVTTITADLDEEFPPL